MSKVKVQPATTPLVGERKLLVAIIAVATLLLGLLILLAFHQFTEGMWTAWCLAVAGMGGVYTAGNVVSKIVDGKQK